MNLLDFSRKQAQRNLKRNEKKNERKEKTIKKMASAYHFWLQVILLEAKAKTFPPNTRICTTVRLKEYLIIK